MNTQREGWIGDDYVRVFAAHDRARVAQLYDFQTFLPTYEPWGSWGRDALCLGPELKLYLVGWIPLDQEFRKERYASVKDLINDLNSLHEATPAYEHFRKEVHFVTPIVFGGVPSADPVMIDQTAHAEVCRFWNATYTRMKKQGQLARPSNAG